MNSYVSSNEKAQLIRVILMKEVLQDAIDIYSGLDSIDKAFLAELRHGRTRIEKAVKLRRLALDNDADNKLVTSAAKLHPMFLPTPEAKKAHKEIMELQGTLPMNTEDLQDWYGFVIEFTCRNCIKADYTECPARRVLAKYEICPIDPGAKGKCQYSYVEDITVVKSKVPGIIEKPEFAELGSVSFREHYTVKRQVEEMQEKLDLAEKRFDFQTEECLGLLEQNLSLQEQLDEYEKFKLSVSNLLHPNGDGPENPTMVHIFKHILTNWNNFTEQISKLNSENTKLINKNVILSSQNNKLTSGYNEISKMIKNSMSLEKANESISNKHEKYRVECKCGAEYFAYMYNDFPDGRNRAQCHVCHEKVFVDNQAEKVTDPADRIEATLMTNRYFVNIHMRSKAV